MKLRNNLFVVLTFVIFAVAGNAMAQATASDTAVAKATILQKITLTRVTDLQFGKIVTGTAAGTVTVATDNSRSTSGGTGPALANGIAPTAATFTVTGEPSTNYTIVLGGTTGLQVTGPGTAMNVTGFTFTPTTPATLPAAGTDTIAVGATLNVNANQVSGLYTSPNFTVTVTYN